MILRFGDFVIQSAKRSGMQAALIAQRASNVNPSLFKLFQKRLSEYEILLSKAKTELDARIAASGTESVIRDDSK